MVHPVRRLGVAGILIAATASAVVRAQTAIPENRLKAAIVTKIAQFVDWPASAIAGRDHMELCVVRPDPFGSDLSDLIAGETLNGRPITIRVVEPTGDVSGCQVLYVPAEVASKRSILQEAGGKPVLTVSDDAQFLDAGGMIQLREVRGRIRFEINLAVAEKAGLRMSSQLLQLALNVRGAQ